VGVYGVAGVDVDDERHERRELVIVVGLAAFAQAWPVISPAASAMRVPCSAGSRSSAVSGTVGV